jgi:hypothetical protein
MSRDASPNSEYRVRGTYSEVYIVGYSKVYVVDYLEVYMVDYSEV